MPAPRTDTPKKRSRSGPIAALVVLAMLAYPLGMGPMGWMASAGMLPRGAFDFVYDRFVGMMWGETPSWTRGVLVEYLHFWRAGRMLGGTAPEPRPQPPSPSWPNAAEGQDLTI
jgi:hypothetical protein